MSTFEKSSYLQNLTYRCHNYHGKENRITITPLKETFIAQRRGEKSVAPLFGVTSTDVVFSQNLHSYVVKTVHFAKLFFSLNFAEDGTSNENVSYKEYYSNNKNFWAVGNSHFCGWELRANICDVKRKNMQAESLDQTKKY